MKQKRTFIAVLLVIAVLALGVAYASITAIPMTISGTAKAVASNENFNVILDDETEVAVDKTGIVSETARAAAEVSGEVTADDEATISITGLTNKDDYVTVSYNVKNLSPELTAYLTASVESTNTLFTVEPTVATSVAANGETLLTVKVTLNETIAADQTENVVVKLVADSVQP